MSKPTIMVKLSSFLRNIDCVDEFVMGFPLKSRQPFFENRDAFPKFCCKKI